MKMMVMMMMMMGMTVPEDDGNAGMGDQQHQFISISPSV